MAQPKILHAWFDVDLTLTTFDADGAYRAAGAELAKRIGADPYRRLLQDYFSISSTDPKVKDAIAAMFTRQTLIKFPPEEVFWCRTAAFLVVLEHYVDEFGLGWHHVIDAARAEYAFWQHITRTSRMYDDARTLLRSVPPTTTISLVTSSDMRTELKRSLCYDAERSAYLKRERVERVLGRVHPLYVFETHRKASREGWGMYVLPHCKDVDMATSAIIGDSLGDVEAGVTMEMPIRILIDRNGKYDSRPEPATHLVRSLDEVPAILGWL